MDTATDAKIRKAFREEPEGDFLVFMPGVYEITKTIAAIAGTPEGARCAVFPLYGELSAEAQDRAVAPAPAGTRKVVVATNVAETSLTIPGVRVVIDSGLARVACYDPRRGINTLLIENISRSSADQRAGRAGRTAPGRCIRLWTKSAQESRPARDVPEVRRVELSEALLLLKAGGVENLGAFPWFEKPDAVSLENSLALLRELGALDAAGALTRTGAAMARFPLHPRFSRMMIAARELGCLPQIAAGLVILRQPEKCFSAQTESVVLFRIRPFGKILVPIELRNILPAFALVENLHFQKFPGASLKTERHSFRIREFARLDIIESRLHESSVFRAFRSLFRQLFETGCGFRGSEFHRGLKILRKSAMDVSGQSCEEESGEKLSFHFCLPFI